MEFPQAERSNRYAISAAKSAIIWSTASSGVACPVSTCWKFGSTDVLAQPGAPTKASGGTPMEIASTAAV